MEGNTPAGPMSLFGDEPDFTFTEELFEANCFENGFTFWRASSLAEMLGYDSMKSFRNAIEKAVGTLMTLKIPVTENIVEINEVVDNRTVTDFKLSRFACYLTVMQADNKKKQVARAQEYFAMLAGAVSDYYQQIDNVDRINYRGEISEREKQLSRVAATAQVENYSFFANAGYRGMYNMNIGRLRELRQIPSGRSPLDFMGKEELAANLFRLTQTQLKIQAEKIVGQAALERTAESVGKQVRQSMIEISGIPPERLGKHDDINEVKKSLKKKPKELNSLDKKKSPRKKG